jgi:hypothetical protein
MASEVVKLGREWLALLDNDTRPDHVDANGQVVGPGELFEVGGEEAPYPGHWSLSVEERVNCRCTILAASLEEEEGEEEDRD